MSNFPYKKIHLSKNHSKGEQIALFYQLLRGKKDYVSVIYISFYDGNRGGSRTLTSYDTEVKALYGYQLHHPAIVGYSVVMTLSFHLFSIRFGLELLNRAATGGL